MRLIPGAPGTGKTALVFREFKEALRQGGAPPRIVVPTATLVRHFQHELARDGCVFAPSSVISLNRFIAERALPLRPVPEGLLRLLVRHALRHLRLPEFGQVSETSGMAATILETISLFENAGCTPARLAAVRKLSPQARAFERIWRRADDELRERGYESIPALVRAAARSERRERIWMDGFVHLSPLEKELVNALAQTCELTRTVTETAEPGHQLPLFGSGRKPSVAVVAAASMEREADEIARRMLALNSEEGVAFRDMAVAVRDERSYAALLRSTFERFGIPARYYFGSPLNRQPAAQFLSGLIDCALNGWEHGAALEALRMHPGWGAGAAFDRFDFQVREAMPGRGLEALDVLAEGGLDTCVTVDGWRSERLRPGAWKILFETFLATHYRPGFVDAAKDFSAVATARSHVAALRAIGDALGHAVAFFGEAAEPIALGEFWPVASEAIDGGTIQPADERRNVAHVINVFEARQWDVSALFVCGMTDRDFPKKNSQNLLFPDHEIEALQKAGIPLRRAADLDNEEPALFASLQTRAARSLVMTYPLHNAAGTGAECSRLLKGLAAVAPEACLVTPAGAAPSVGLPGRLNSEELLMAFGEKHRNISISALEDLAQCRFKFFANRTLGLKGRPDRPEQRLEPRSRGLILHKALEEWLNGGRSGPFLDAFDTAFRTACRETHLPPGYRLEVERLFMLEIARNVRATERWQAETETEVELELDFPGGIRVHGRVDRIDRLDAENCIIVDYKSSIVSSVKELVHSPVKLQGPLYALAAREKLGLNTAAMMYIAIRADKAFGWGHVEGAGLELEPMPPRWMEDARDRAIERLTSLLSGAIHAEPVEIDKCRWCEFAHTCRYSKDAAVVEAVQGA